MNDPLPDTSGTGFEPYVYFDFANPAVLRLLGTDHDVLDVGCGSGAMGEAARAAGNRVTGVELAESAVEAARKRLDRALRFDVTDVTGLARELGEKYDRIVFADILEHLPDPASVLSAYSSLLKPGGRVLISVPNVAAWTVRFGLLLGNFEYAESGILDRTHLRFYTRRSGIRLLEDAGFHLQRWDLTPHMTRAVWPLLKGLFRSDDGQTDPRAVLKSPAYKFYQRWLEPLETLTASILPGLLACQFVFEGSQRPRV